jgi:riboflavin synthase
MGGHYVQGHVDGVGKILSRRPEGDSEFVTFSAPEELMPYIVMKGFVAIDGISLTIAGRGERDFSVALIDFTRHATELGSKPVGAAVNLEVDVIAKYVESLLEGRFGQRPG